MLREALDSVFAQEFTDYEVIVVDDGSTEDLSAIIETYGDRLTFVRQVNSGPGVARNTGVSHAKGEYIAFLDSDDMWFPWTLSVIADVIHDAEKPSLILGSGTWFSDENELRGIIKTSITYQAFSDFLAASRVLSWLGSGALVVRSDQFHASQGFVPDLRVAEDLDLFLRLGEASGFVLLEQPTTFGYRQHPANSIHNIEQTLKGAFHLIHCERNGLYPGGKGRLAERLMILGRIMRPPSLAAVKSGRFRDAWRIYRQTFLWHCRLGRVKYLLSFPCIAVTTQFTRDVFPVK